MKPEEILSILDRFAIESNFPVLDNAHVHLADARMTAYRSSQDWAIVFDFVGYAEPEIEFVDDIYAFGSNLARQGILGERIILRQVPQEPLFDPETNECIADCTDWAVMLDSKRLSFKPASNDYTEAGIALNYESGKGTISPEQILRFLVQRVGHRFFASDPELLEFVPECRASAKFFVCPEWQHPKIAQGEMPSQTISFRSLALALAAGNSSLFETGQVNTHWRNWV